MAKMPELPSLPSSSSPRRLRACYCGCGTPTASTFAPGHDSTLKAWVIRVERGVIAIGDIGHEGLTKAVRATLKSRAEGKNVTFMRNVPLPVKAAAVKVPKAPKAETAAVIETPEIEKAG